jgi:predicted metal-dependent peptidase
MSNISKNTTSNDLHVKRKVDPIRLASFDISTYLTRLLWIEPFYSRLLRSMNKIETTEIPTAAVSTSLDKINFYYNKEFFASLKDREIIGVLKHECLHLLYEHTTTRRKTPHIIWNYATDLAINTLLTVTELPKGGLIPGRHLEALTIEQKASMTDEQIKRYDNISNLIASFPPYKSSEYYYERLMENDDIKDMIEKSANFEIIFGEGMDDHNKWDELSDEEKEMVKQKVQELVKDAQQECEHTKNWGSVPSNVIKHIKTMLTKEIPWEDLLKRFVGFSNRNERTTSVTRLNRKYPGVHLGIQKDYKPHIAVYVDESGSVTDGDLETFYSELNNLSSICSFTLFKFDTEVDVENAIEIKKGKRFNTKRTRTGGTNFDAPTKHANDHKKLYDGLIIMTDGGAPKPKLSRLRRCYVISPGNTLYFGNHNIDTKDFIVTMKQASKKTA